jgi:hypothetical protein
LRRDGVGALAGHDDAGSFSVFFGSGGLVRQLCEVTITVGQVGDGEAGEEIGDCGLSRIGWRGYCVAFYRGSAGADGGGFIGSRDFELEDDLCAAAKCERDADGTAQDKFVCLGIDRVSAGD